MDIEDLEDDPEQTKLLKTVKEVHRYIAVNRAFIPNYGDRCRNGKTISVAFAKSPLNQVFSNRFSNKQQIHWRKRGGHLLLQVRT